MATAIRTIYPTIPDVRSDMGSIIAAVQALKNSVNLLIINSQSNPQSPNLSGTKIFATYADHSNLSSNVLANASDITTLQNDINTINAEITALQSSVTTLQGQVTTLQGQVSTLQTNVTTLQGQVATLQTNVTTLQTNVTTLQGQVTTLNKLVLSPSSVSALPTATTNNGARGLVTDSTVVYSGANIAIVVVGGGTNIVPVYSDGTNWRIG